MEATKGGHPILLTKKDNPFCARLFGRRRISALLMAVFVPAALFANGQPDDLFQKALVKESVDRNLEGAINLYQQTVGHPKVGPGVAAEARLRMGLCYEKLAQPQEAETVYRQLLARTSGASPEIIQQAKARLRQVEAENHLGVTSGNPGKIVWVRRYQWSPLSVLSGPTASAGSNSLTFYSLMVGLRWRLSAPDRPFPFSVELRGVVPLVNSTIETQFSPSNLQGPTSASLKVQYQTSLGLVSQLPHGQQRTVIPEVGAGFILTASQISFANATSSGEQSDKQWSPYLETGAQLFSDRTVSLLMHVTYIPTPYTRSIDAGGMGGSHSFGFPTAQWALGAIVQTKVGYYHSVPELHK